MIESGNMWDLQKHDVSSICNILVQRMLDFFLHAISSQIRPLWIDVVCPQYHSHVATFVHDINIRRFAIRMLNT